MRKLNGLESVREILEMQTKGELVVALNYGGGANSTAMLVELVERGAPPDIILCADTGAEKPEFYAYINDVMNPWLAARGSKPIHLTRWRRKIKSKLGYVPGQFVPLDKWCEDTSSLPSVAFGLKGCSVKWKAQPLDSMLNKILEGITIPAVRLFGFDADERRRLKEFDPQGRRCFAPLVEWDWGREECIDRIARAGLPLPGKSACYMCPHNRPEEILRLKVEHSDLYDRAIRMEEAWMREGKAEGSSIKGLGRSFAWADVEKVRADQVAERDNPCMCVDG